MKESSHVIWQKITKSDKKAFEILYKEYFPSLCLYAYGFIHDEEYVMEIVNDVFLRIWEKRSEIDINHGIKPYLYRCTHNKCIDKLAVKKELKADMMVELADKVNELCGQDEESILMQISLNNLESDIQKSIEELPPKCREIFKLSRYDMLSYYEISKKLDISVNTIKTQITRALDSLRIKLKEHL
jgi:RNA polymerase sigma-70 factor (family 1)